MFNLRRVMRLPLTGFLKEDDMQLLEQENFTSMDLKTLKEKLLENPLKAELPQIYKNGKKGGEVQTKGDVFSTVESLLEVSYGEITEDAFIYLGLFDYSQNYFKFGKCVIKEGSPDFVEFELTDSSTLFFEKGSGATFNGFVVSIFGEVLGTEDFVEN